MTQLACGWLAALSLVLALSVSLVLSLGGAARAQVDGNDAEARRLYEGARTAFQAGEFEGAVRQFRRAYLLSPRAALLYNIGQAELRAGHDGLGLEAFEAFLRQAPAEDPRRSEVEERIRMLRSMGVRPATQAEAERAQADAQGAVEGTSVDAHDDTHDTPDTPDTHDTHDTADDATLVHAPLEPHDDGAIVDAGASRAAAERGPGVAPWIVSGAGGAMLVAGAVMMGVAVSEAEGVSHASPGTPWAGLEQTASEAQTLWGVGIAMLGVGAAACAGGLAWGLLDTGDASSPHARLRLVPGMVFVEGAL